MTCCFIGHKNTSRDVFGSLLFEINKLIDEQGVDNFYVGHNGTFDRMAYNILKSHKENLNTDIKFNVVLAYIPEPGKKPEYEYTIYPEGLETVPKKFAINKRNEWMIDNSDYVVCYVTNTFSNAHKFRDYAIRKNKKIIDI